MRPAVFAPSGTALCFEPLAQLVSRFDPDVIDVPDRRARVRLEVEDAGAWDALIDDGEIELRAANGGEPDATLSADAEAWQAIAADVRGGMDAYRAGRLHVRRNLHLGVGFLAATSDGSEPGRLRFDRVRTRFGEVSMLEAGVGEAEEPVVCIHGLGGTKASFLPTVSALAHDHRVIALDLPGFGDSEKPLTASYDAPWFARAVVGLLDELGVERAHLVGNSMGGRVAIELGLMHPDRAGCVVLLSPALAWLRDRQWKWLLSLPLPHLGLIQYTPRGITEEIVRRIVPGGFDGWAAAGVDEFLRAFCTPRGRFAFYSAARHIYLDEPHGENGFWTRLRELSHQSMFVWGRNDQLVPVAFMKHVERTLPEARHVELDCGHVPQVEAPAETHAAIADFLAPSGVRGAIPRWMRRRRAAA